MVAITEFEIILMVLFTISSAFAAWLYRHERWFRDRVFPVLLLLTGRDPTGDKPDPTTEGHFQETETRFEKVEKDTEQAAETAKEALEVAKETREDIQELSEKQDRYHERNESILRTILSHVDGVDDDDIDRPLFRGGSRREDGDTDPTTDGGKRVERENKTENAD
jgi:hypothetical protein